MAGSHEGHWNNAWNSSAIPQTHCTQRHEDEQSTSLDELIPDSGDDQFVNTDISPQRIWQGGTHPESLARTAVYEPSYPYQYQPRYSTDAYTGPYYRPAIVTLAPDDWLTNPDFTAAGSIYPGFPNVVNNGTPLDPDPGYPLPETGSVDHSSGTDGGMQMQTYPYRSAVAQTWSDASRLLLATDHTDTNANTPSLVSSFHEQGSFQQDVHVSVLHHPASTQFQTTTALSPYLVQAQLVLQGVNNAYAAGHSVSKSPESSQQINSSVGYSTGTEGLGAPPLQSSEQSLSRSSRAHHRPLKQKFLQKHTQAIASSSNGPFSSGSHSYLASRSTSSNGTSISSVRRQRSRGPYICPVCSEVFLRKDQYTRHLHIKEACPFCEKLYARHDLVVRHVRKNCKRGTKEQRKSYLDSLPSGNLGADRYSVFSQGQMHSIAETDEDVPQPVPMSGVAVQQGYSLLGSPDNPLWEPAQDTAQEPHSDFDLDEYLQTPKNGSREATPKENILAFSNNAFEMAEVLDSPQGQCH